MQAWCTLQANPDVQMMHLSSPYQTEPMDMASSNMFINAAAIGWTTYTPFELLHLLHRIEKNAGRKRKPGQGYQDRILDLDLLLYDGRVIATQELTVPHPRMLERLFVLEPLAEIGPQMLHTASGLTVLAHQRQLRNQVGDQGVEPTRWS